MIGHAIFGIRVNENGQPRTVEHQPGEIRPNWPRDILTRKLGLV
jgi:hypothetical protein